MGGIRVRLLAATDCANLRRNIAAPSVGRTMVGIRADARMCKLIAVVHMSFRQALGFLVKGRRSAIG